MFKNETHYAAKVRVKPELHSCIRKMLHSGVFAGPFTSFFWKYMTVYCVSVWYWSVFVWTVCSHWHSRTVHGCSREAGPCTLLLIHKKMEAVWEHHSGSLFDRSSFQHNVPPSQSCNYFNLFCAFSTGAEHDGDWRPCLVEGLCHGCMLQFYRPARTGENKGDHSTSLQIVCPLLPSSDDLITWKTVHNSPKVT